MLNQDIFGYLAEFVELEDLLNVLIAFRLTNKIDIYLQKLVKVHTSELGTDYKLPNGKFYRIDGPASIRKTRTIWYKKGVIHRDNDEPAIIYDDGTLVWYKNGEIHRDNDKPARIDNFGGDIMWYKNGLIHRDNDKPAIIHKYYVKWFMNGEWHRDNDKPALIGYDDSGLTIKEWHRYGLLHRDNDLPAMEWRNGGRTWAQNGVITKFVNIFETS